MEAKFTIEIVLPDYEIKDIENNPFRDKSLTLEETLNKELEETLKYFSIEYGWRIELKNLEVTE